MVVDAPSPVVRAHLHAVASRGGTYRCPGELRDGHGPLRAVVGGVGVEDARARRRTDWSVPLLRACNTTVRTTCCSFATLPGWHEMVVFRKRVPQLTAASHAIMPEMATKRPSGAKRVRAARTQRLASQRSSESFRAAWRRASAEVARRDADVLRVLADFDRGVPLPSA